MSEFILTFHLGPPFYFSTIGYSSLKLILPPTFTGTKKTISLSRITTALSFINYSFLIFITLVMVTLLLNWQYSHCTCFGCFLAFKIDCCLWCYQISKKAPAAIKNSTLPIHLIHNTVQQQSNYSLFLY